MESEGGKEVNGCNYILLVNFSVVLCHCRVDKCQLQCFIFDTWLYHPYFTVHHAQIEGSTLVTMGI